MGSETPKPIPPLIENKKSIPELPEINKKATQLSKPIPEQAPSPQRCVFVYIQPKNKLDTIVGAQSEEDQGAAKQADLEAKQKFENLQINDNKEEQKQKQEEKKIEVLAKDPKNKAKGKKRKKTNKVKDKDKENEKNGGQELNVKRKSQLSNSPKQEYTSEKQKQEEKEQKDQKDQKEQKGELGKILVQWNSFIKVKKKNYLQDYAHVKEIGKGAFGTVSKIKMKYGGIFRAAKIIKSAAFDKKLINRDKFINEIVIPMKLDHPNLNKLFEVFEWKNQFVLVMQLCEGGDLFNRIKKGGIFTEKKVAEMLKQILSAVVYMHKNNIVHRDLKPQNMLYDTESNSLKLIDFGTAIQRKDMSKKLTSLVGTPYYIAPEVIKGSYDEKCDVWSCGVILYLLLCGIPPFVGHNEKEIMRKVITDPIVFKDHIWKRRSKGSQELITKMLNKNPDERITAMDALSSEWMVNAENQNQELTDVGNQVMKNLQSFHFQNKLKAVVYTYIASQLYSNKDKEKLLKAFRQIDKDGDGVIGKEELLEIFQNYESCSFTEVEIQKIITLVDTNGSGLIDFTEFLVAASNEEELLQRQRLQNAFTYLDTDHSGYITPQEIKQFLDDTQETSEEIRKIFDEVDQNGDGKISKKEFLTLLLKKE